jgi:PEP-CTERM motif
MIFAPSGRKREDILSPRYILHRSIPLLILAVWCLAPGEAASADVTYVVSVDTSGIPSPTTGIIDFQFNPNTSAAVAAAADVTNFSTDGALITTVSPPSPSTTGDVTGTLPGSLLIRNDDPGGINDYNQSFTYGSYISFDVSLALTGTVGPGSTGSTFYLTLYDGSGNPYSTGPALPGETVAITINPDGTATPAGYGPVNGSFPTVTVTPLTTTIPEPSTMVLGGFGIAVLLGWQCIRFRRAA